MTRSGPTIKPVERSISQYTFSDHLVHGPVSVLCDGHSVGPRGDVGRSHGRLGILRHHRLGEALRRQSLDRRSHPDLFRVQCRDGSLACSRFLQPVPSQLL